MLLAQADQLNNIQLQESWTMMEQGEKKGYYKHVKKSLVLHNSGETPSVLTGYRNMSSTAVDKNLTSSNDNAANSSSTSYKSEQINNDNSSPDGQGVDHSISSHSLTDTNSAPLIDPFEIKGTHGQSYRIYPCVTKEQAQTIEQATGIILKAEEEKISGYLGGGQYGRVYVAEIVGENQFCAVKIIRGTPEILAESAHEAEIQQKLCERRDVSQAHFMPLIDTLKVFDSESGKLNCLYYILPLAALGNVETLRKQLSTLDNRELRRLLSWHIANGLLLGLWQMHQQKIYHLDVKLANLLVNKEGRVRVADFGTSENINETSPLLKPKRNAEGRFIGNGDSTYFPPERNWGDTFNCEKADSYAAGLALWELATGESITDTNDYENPENLLEAIEQAPTNSLADVARHLIQRDPRQRWTLEQALDHPIFQAPDLHDQTTMAVVLDFLKRFVQQVQLAARDPNINLSLNELAQSQVNEVKNTLENKLKAIRQSFENRPDIHEQLKLYLPLKGSLTREVKDLEKESVDLAAKTNEFLNNSNQAVLLILADGGSGKSLFVQRLTLELLDEEHDNSSELKPILPLYVNLGSIKQPGNLLKEAFDLSHSELKVLEKTYQLLLIADGYDEQQQRVNLYVQNRLHQYNIKTIITCRTNALPSYYASYFIPQVPGERLARDYQEIYIQPFTPAQIEMYVQNYVEINEKELKGQVKLKQLSEEWLTSKHYLQKIAEMTGLKELIQTPLMCRFILEALPQLAKTQNNNDQIIKITRTQVYEAFLLRWTHQQIDKQLTAMDDNQVWIVGQKIAAQLFLENRSVQIDLSSSKFSFDIKQGCYQLQPHSWDWFFQVNAERQSLPLQETQKGQFKFLHLSIQEFLLARHLYQQLINAEDLKDLDWNRWVLTVDIRDRPILYFLAGFLQQDPKLQIKLFQMIEQSKTDRTQARAAANAITVLNAAEVNLSSKDFQDIAIPDADLSGVIADSTHWNNSDLNGVNFEGAWLRGGQFEQAEMANLRLSEYVPFSEKNNQIREFCLSPDGKILIIHVAKEIKFYDIKTRQLLKTIEVKSRVEEFLAIEAEMSLMANSQNHVKRETLKVCEVKIIYSPNGKHLAISNNERGYTYSTLAIWDIENKPLSVLERNYQELDPHSSLSFVYSPDGMQLAVACYSNPERGFSDNRIRIWNAENGKFILDLIGHTGKINSIDYSPDGNQLVSGSNDKTVRVWDIETGDYVRIFRGHQADVVSVKFCTSKKQVISSSQDGVVKIWDIEAQACIKTLFENNQEITINHIVYFSPSELVVLANGIIKFLNIETAECVRTLSDFTHDISKAVYLPKLRLMAAMTKRKVMFWDVKIGTLLKNVNNDVHTANVNCFAYSLDGQQVASGSGNEIMLWDAATENFNLIKSLGNVTESVICLASSSDGKQLVSIHESPSKATMNNQNNSIKVWNIASGDRLEALAYKIYCIPTLDSIDLNNIPVNTLYLYHKTDTSLGYVVKKGEQSTNGEIQQQTRSEEEEQSELEQRLETLRGGVELPVWKKPQFNKVSPLEEVFSKHRQLENKVFNVFTEILKSMVELQQYEITSEEAHLLFSLTAERGHTPDISQPIMSCIYSPVGKKIILISNHTIIVCDPHTGGFTKTLFKTFENIISIAYSACRRFVALGYSNGTVELVNLENGNCIKTFDETQITGTIITMAFSSDNNQLAVVVQRELDDYSNIQILDIGKGQVLTTLSEPVKITNVGYDFNNHWIITASNGNTLKIWDIATGKCLQSFSLPSAITHLAFQSNSNRLIIALSKILLFAAIEKDLSFKLLSIKQNINSLVLTNTDITLAKGLNQDTLDFFNEKSQDPKATDNASLAEDSASLDSTLHEQEEFSIDERNPADMKCIEKDYIKEMTDEYGHLNLMDQFSAFATSHQEPGILEEEEDSTLRNKHDSFQFTEEKINEENRIHVSTEEAELLSRLENLSENKIENDHDTGFLNKRPFIEEEMKEETMIDFLEQEADLLSRLSILKKNKMEDDDQNTEITRESFLEKENADLKKSLDVLSKELEEVERELEELRSLKKQLKSSENIKPSAQYNNNQFFKPDLKKSDNLSEESSLLSEETPLLRNVQNENKSPSEGCCVLI